MTVTEHVPRDTWEIHVWAFVIGYIAVLLAATVILLTTGRGCSCSGVGPGYGQPARIRSSWSAS